MARAYARWQLLGESALHYVMDARQRLTPGASVVPRRGAQFATLIESEDVASITSVKGWEGIDLGWFNTLQDTTSMVFTKQYGFRFSSCSYRELAPKQTVLGLDFANDAVGVWRGERRQQLRASASGTVHAILASWEVRATRPPKSHEPAASAPVAPTRSPGYCICAAAIVIGPTISPSATSSL